jgi:hypothetical protein
VIAVRAPFAAGVLALVCALPSGGTRARAPAPEPRRADAASPIVHVPRASGEVTLDGELEEPVWTSAAARTGAIGTRPFSEARFAWRRAEAARGDELIVALYAADEEITSRATEPDGPLWLDDAFRLVFTGDDGDERAIDVSPLGAVTDARRSGGGAFDYGWSSGARVGHDADGTINDPRDDDEEWVLEVSIPLAALGVTPRAGGRTRVEIRRCDTPRRSHRACSAWTGELVLD